MVSKIKLSKFLSYILRHDPGSWDLELDGCGYAPLADVLRVLRKRFRKFKEEDLFELVKNEPKGRFEVSAKKIRATYGHSLEVRPGSESIIPPEVLYHGTSPEDLEKILAEGLKPMSRQFVHLSSNEKDAYMVGMRHAQTPVILEVMAKEAALKDIKFYREGKLFLAKNVPPEYIKAKKEGRNI
ncbi:MAG: RNA 2'-phosphotransferase [Candidatus Omnitrophota bacterium]|nr:RNA 2'-phosphotransferase [Candidatus Omnitrophota bacterium]